MRQKLEPRVRRGLLGAGGFIAVATAANHYFPEQTFIVLVSATVLMALKLWL